MLSADIEDYSGRTDAGQRQLQTALAGVLKAASDAAGLKRQDWWVQVGGDSVFAILPPGTDVARLMDRFVREINAELGGYNRRRSGEAWTRMRLRLAVHAGPVFLDGRTGWPGQHAVLPARLRDCEPVRAALAALREADLAVIVSGDVYRDYITQGPGNPRPTEFREVLAQPKKAAYVGHLIVPGFDVHAISTLAAYDLPDVSPSQAEERSPAGGERPAARPPAAASWPTSPATPGRDVVNGDKNRVSGGGSIYHAGRDITVSGGHQGRGER